MKNKLIVTGWSNVLIFRAIQCADLCEFVKKTADEALKFTFTKETYYMINISTYIHKQQTS